MPFYVIERKLDGARFPEITGQKNKGGYTHQEPSLTLPPRLFGTARAASNALTCWLKGPTTKHYRSCGEFGEDTWEDFESKPDARRGGKSDYEVIPVQVCRMVKA